MNLPVAGSNLVRAPLVSGSQSVPSGFFAMAVGRRPASGHSVIVSLIGSNFAIRKPPSSVTQNVPSGSLRSELGVASVVIIHRLTVFLSDERRRMTFSG